MIGLIRKGLGGILVFGSKLTQPKPIERTPEEQARVAEAAKALSIYQFHGCPFCIKVRRVAHRLGVPVEYRDAQPGSPYREELEREGGKIQVPCLRIEENDSIRWLYESSEVIAYLNKKFG